MALDAFPKYLYVKVVGDIDELVEALREMEINVDSNDGDNVRVYCA